MPTPQVVPRYVPVAVSTSDNDDDEEVADEEGLLNEGHLSRIDDT